MLLVKTTIGKSNIHGIGIFAAQSISKGTVVWKFTPKFDIIMPAEEVNKLEEIAKNTFLKYAYLNKRTHNYTLCCDDARFFNHSDDPNVVSVDTDDDQEGLDVATRDILEGEELTANYDEFDGEAEKKLRDAFRVATK